MDLQSPFHQIRTGLYDDCLESCRSTLPGSGHPNCQAEASQDDVRRWDVGTQAASGLDRSERDASGGSPLTDSHRDRIRHRGAEFGSQGDRRRRPSGNAVPSPTRKESGKLSGRTRGHSSGLDLATSHRFADAGNPRSEITCRAIDRRHGRRLQSSGRSHPTVRVAVL